MIGIYKITNPQGKVYIGQSVNIPSRFEQHKKSISSEINKTSKLYKSFIEFGVDFHTFEIQEICLKKSLNQRERFWQMHFDSVGSGLNGVYVSEIANYNHSNNEEKNAKLIHLSDETIQILTIESVKLGKTFKIYVQELLIEKASNLIINKAKSQSLKKCADEVLKTTK